MKHANPLTIIPPKRVRLPRCRRSFRIKVAGEASCLVRRTKAKQLSLGFPGDGTTFSFSALPGELRQSQRVRARGSKQNTYAEKILGHCRSEINFCWLQTAETCPIVFPMCTCEPVLGMSTTLDSSAEVVRIQRTILERKDELKLYNIVIIPALMHIYSAGYSFVFVPPPWSVYRQGTSTSYTQHRASRISHPNIHSNHASIITSDRRHLKDQEHTQYIDCSPGNVPSATLHQGSTGLQLLQPDPVMP